MTAFPENFRAGFVAVVGRPNVGKSSLVNTLVGEHIAIVSPRAQTTRRTVRACRQDADSQIVFVDLPGSQRPMDRMTSRMQRTVEEQLGEVDAIVWVTDVTARPGRGEHYLAERIVAAGTPFIVCPNKIDRVGPERIAEQIVAITELIPPDSFAAVVPVSARTGKGCNTLLDEIVKLLPDGPPVFPTDMVTDLRDDERIAEYIREAALPRLRDELPHALAVEVTDVEEDDDLLRVYADLLVESKSQVGIVVGKAGERIRDIGTDARAVIEAALATRVHLDLRVKVRREWRNTDPDLDRLGV